MQLNVHYHTRLSPEVLDRLRSELEPGIHLTAGVEFPPKPDYQVLVNGTPDLEQLTASLLLNTLVIPYAGVPLKTRQLISDFPNLKVHNLHHNAAPTGEMAVALMLAAAKFLVPIDRTFRQHDWTPRYQPNPSILLAGKHALILGFGHIGQRVALVCRSLGMQVTGIRRHPQQPFLLPGVEARVCPPTDLEALLPDCHVLIITLPFTSYTEGMIGARQLSLMPPGGILVNVGRGAIVEQQALFSALQEGRLAAAGLDVWYNYPQDPDHRTHTPPADFPFHHLDNVVMSPHRGGGSQETDLLRMSHLAVLLNALSQGKSETNRVDLQAGY
jgi:phosphoglycerate dehydrogenase-like enzyme